MKFVFALALALFTTVAAQSQELAKRPISLTLSGGVSLGSYESGFLYYLMHQLNDNRLGDLKIVTGASAGSINGLIAILNACQSSVTSPQQSINWKVWVPVGIKDLARPEDVTPISILSREGVRKSTRQIKNAFMAGLSSQCEVVFGVVVTRKIPEQVEIQSGLHRDRHSEYFLFKIKGRGFGAPPEIENFPLNEEGRQQLFLPFVANEPKRNYDLLESVLFASAQFPLAFPPYPLEFCDLPATASPWACTKDQIKKADFIDGGIFNNIPVNLANLIAKHFLGPAESSRTLYSVITVSGTTHPPEDESSDKNSSMLPYLTQLFSHLSETSKNFNVSETYSNNKDLQKQTFANEKLLPRASQYYYAFSGFLDREFREYDFYLGMFEALKLIQRENAQASAPELKKYLDEKISTKDIAANPSEWAPYFCLRDTYSLNSPNPKSCESKNLRKNFHLLLQTNAEIVSARCQFAAKDLAAKFKSCEMVKNLKLTSTLQAGESDQTYFFRRLQNLGYKYELAKNDADTAENILRDNLEPILSALIEKQPKEQRFMAQGGLSLILNSLSYRPIEQRNILGVGTHLQISRNRLLSHYSSRPWFYAGDGLMIRNIETFLNRSPDSLTLAPFVSLSSNWTSKKFFWLEPELGLRLGYNYSIRKAEHACDRTHTWEPLSLCRAVFLQPNISISLLRSLRLEIGTILYLSKNHLMDSTALIEVQF